MHNHTRTIVPLERLSRSAICARIAITRRAMDDMAAMAELDGGPAFACLGRMRVTLITLEQHLRKMDRGDFTPVPAEVRAAMEAQK
jgi:hypothetical protein